MSSTQHISKKGTGSGSVVVSLADQDQSKAIQIGKSLGVEPVLSRDQIGGDLAPVTDYKWCIDRAVLPLQDGRLLFSDTHHIHLARDLMRSRSIRVTQQLPITTALLRTLLDEIFDGDPEAGSDLSIREKSEIEQRIDWLIEAALKSVASDVHVYVRPSRTLIRFRVGGRLVDYEEGPHRLGIGIAQVLFNVMADVGREVYNPRVPADGTMVRRISDSVVRVRLASMPTHPEGTVKVVMRVLPTDRKAATLKSLGYNPSQVRLILGALSRPHGMILIAGPTGSGKSTTLAAMNSMFSQEEETITIEDPPEYELPGATQVPADTRNPEKDFSAMIRGSMRMDPDNIMVGEIRDESTADSAVSAAVTGHRVLSTVHAKSSTSIVTRLVKLGVDRSLLGDSELLVALMFQRLVRTVCSKCAFHLSQNVDAFKKRYGGLYQRLWIAAGRDEKKLSAVRFHGDGCTACRNTGYAGRTVVAEVTYLDREGSRLIEHGKIAEWEAHLLRMNWKPLRAHLLEKILSGSISPVDGEPIVGSLSEDSIGESFDYDQDIELIGG